MAENNIFLQQSSAHFDFIIYLETSKPNQINPKFRALHLCRHGSSQPSNTLHQNGYAEYYADNMMTTRQVHTSYHANSNSGYHSNPTISTSYPSNNSGNPGMSPTPNISVMYLNKKDNLANNPNVARTYVDPGHANPGIKRTIQDYSGTLEISVDEDQCSNPSNYGDAPLRPSTGDVIYTQPGKCLS